MATVKIKFKPSVGNDGQGYVIYMITHNRISRQLKAGYHLSAYEWENRFSEKVISLLDESRKRYISDMNTHINKSLDCLILIIADFDARKTPYTSDDVIAAFKANKHQKRFSLFMMEMILQLKDLGKIRTSETYASALNSFKRFLMGKDVLLDEIDSDMMLAYEAYLRNVGVCLNTSSFYMRNLRAVYNKAVEKELTIQRFPFKHVYTGVCKTVKRSVSLKVIKQIKEMDLSNTPSLDFIRDMFLFSFYTRGMSFIDMAYLRKKDLNGGVLSYCRRKTGQLLFIKWEKCMQKIVEKYDTSQSIYLLPIIKPLSEMDSRKQYIYAAHNVTYGLKIIGKKLGLSVPLTMYVSRHTWASVAKSKNVPISVISEGMGHDSESTTRIYLSSLDNIAIDKANSLILKSL